MEVAADALEASCLVKPTTHDTAGARGHSLEAPRDPGNSRQNNRWRRKIRATFPLILIKHFHRSSQEKVGPETVPEVDSDFEEIPSAADPSQSESRTLADTQNPSGQSAAAVRNEKKRLMLSAADKEKLLSWDALLTPEEAPFNTTPLNAPRATEQVPAEADKLQADSGQSREPSPSQTSSSSSSSSSPSAFQLIVNAFRRTFSVTDASGRSSAAAPTRTRPSGPRKQRPVSEGALSFGRAASHPSRDEKTKKKSDAHWASVGANPWGAGRDLPSLLRRGSGGVFTEDLPGRRVHLFSSMRNRKREESESEGQEVRTILTNLRNKASRQQDLNEPSSSDDEELTSNQKLSPDRLRRRQERTAAQQAKREELKRLHRAQAIQRQLEEVAEKQKDLEEQGVAIEKIIRGETESSPAEDSDESRLQQSWFRLVLEKNKLERYESELVIFAQELELEDTQSRLQQDLRGRIAIEDTTKSASELQEEQVLLAELMRTVEKRDTLVSELEEQRLKERAEDRDLESLVLSRGYQFLWAQAECSGDPENLENLE